MKATLFKYKISTETTFKRKTLEPLISGKNDKETGENYTEII